MWEANEQYLSAQEVACLAPALANCPSEPCLHRSLSLVQVIACTPIPGTLSVTHNPCRHSDLHDSPLETEPKRTSARTAKADRRGRGRLQGGGSRARRGRTCGCAGSPAASWSAPALCHLAPRSQSRPHQCTCGHAGQKSQSPWNSNGDGCMKWHPNG